MGKHLDAVKAFDEFRAPWETADGTEAEIDKPKLKRYIYGLVTDKAKAQDAREEAVENVTRLEGELDEAKKEAASSNGEEAQKKIDKLTRDLTTAREKVTSLEAKIEESELRSEVLEGLDPKYAKYVTGTTREELEQSRAQVEADFGLDSGGDNDDEGEDEDEPPARTRPQSRLRNVRDPENNKGPDAIDFDKVADEILGSSVFH